jgi:hypothetical protein
MSSITTSIVFPGPLRKGETHCDLRPFSVSVYFLGRLPASLAEREIVSVVPYAAQYRSNHVD